VSCQTTKKQLLVSQWATNDDAAMAITTGTFSELANDKQLSKAKALQRSMLKVLNNTEKPYYSHPLFWAPFIVVGT